jgi:hypothetical protein
MPLTLRSVLLSEFADIVSFKLILRADETGVETNVAVPWTLPLAKFFNHTQRVIAFEAQI